MPEQRPRGFPRRFPVRPDTGLTLRYRACKLGCHAFCGYEGGRLRVSGAENIPERGPLVVASNHLSILDSMLLGALIPGAAAAMAKTELFANPVISWVFAGCNVFPVDRGSADRTALKMAIDLFDRGGRLVLYIEGTRAVVPGMGRAEPGVGFLLRRRRIPVMPVGIWGTEAALVRGRRLPRRVPMGITFGVPQVIDVPPEQVRDSQAIADLVGDRVARLLPAEYRGHYARAVEADDPR